MPRVSLRRRLLGPPAVAVHRLALRALSALPRGRTAPDAGPVRFVLAHAWGMGGTIRTTLTMAGHLAATREVEVVSVIRRRAEPFFPFPPGVRVRALEDRGAHRILSRLPSVLVHPEDYAYPSCSLQTDVAFVRWLRSLEGGVVVTTRPAFNLLAARLAPGSVVTVGQEHQHLAIHRPRLAADIRRHYGRLDALSTLTTQDERDYGRLLAGSRTRVEHIPNPVPLADPPMADPDAKIVVAAGRLNLQKGFDLLVPAFAAATRRHPEWRLRIYGSGPERARLQAQIDALGAGDRIALLGRSERLVEAMAEASIFALSSRWEGFPMVLLEAIAIGLPIVSFDCPTGPRDIVGEGRGGVLVPPEDVDALAAALDALIADPPRRHALAAAARRRAADFELAAVGARVERLLAHAAALQRPGGPLVSDGLDERVER
jgi:glycosyltransferase involved in cell wall biosynthesis